MEQGDNLRLVQDSRLMKYIYTTFFVKKCYEIKLKPKILSPD